MSETDYPHICVFFCSNCLDHDQIENCCTQLGVDRRTAISLPCSGKVNIPYLVKAFETGADGVVVLTCAMDECRHLEGNRRAKKRVQAVDSLMEEIGIGRGRIAVLEVRDGGHEETTALLKGFCETVRRAQASSEVKATG